MYLYSYVHFTVASCPALSITNGVVTHPTTTLGAVATYSCDTGFQLTGNSNRTCQADSTWTATDPTCEGALLQMNIHRHIAVLCKVHPLTNLVEACFVHLSGGPGNGGEFVHRMHECT